MVLKLFRGFSSGYGGGPDALARKATNDDLFGPSTDELQQLTRLTFKPKPCAKVLGVLEHRFEQSARHWRQKSKTLTIMQFFAIHGSPASLAWMQRQQGTLQTLCRFEYVDSRNNDQGRAVRDKAASLLQVLKDPKKLEEAKRAYKEQKKGLRRSIGTGRPSTTSRNTLEMIRDNIFEDTTDLTGAFQSALGGGGGAAAASSDAARTPEPEPLRGPGGLTAIQEES